MPSNSAITKHEKSRRVRHAQGLLELACCCDDRWGLNRDLKEQAARRALDHLKGARPGSKLRRSSWYVLRGRALLILGKIGQASRNFRAAIKLNPEQPRPYVALAWCYKRAGRLDQSIVALSHGVDRMPEHPILRYNLACCLSLAGQPEQASLELSLAIDIRPTLREKAATEKDFDPIRHHPAFSIITHVV